MPSDGFQAQVFHHELSEIGTLVLDESRKQQRGMPWRGYTEHVLLR